jgi:hypothetical protein
VVEGLAVATVLCARLSGQAGAMRPSSLSAGSTSWSGHAATGTRALAVGTKPRARCGAGTRTRPVVASPKQPRALSCGTARTTPHAYERFIALQRRRSREERATTRLHTDWAYDQWINFDASDQGKLVATPASAHDSPEASDPLRGPHGWLNWLAERAGQPPRSDPHTGGPRLVALWEEYSLYSDAYIQGELQLGPASFWIAFPADDSRLGHAKLALIVRIHSHLGDAAPSQESFASEDVASYHGGTIDDEFAALLSLSLGRRLRSGGLTRHHLGGPEPGRPFMAWHHEPQLAAPPRGRSTLPGIADAVDLSTAAGLMERYATLSGTDATTVVRAAVQYADALWWADLDPRISWLKLVSALEIGARHWAGSAGLSDLERFKHEMGPLYGRLKRFGPDVVEAVSHYLGASAGSTQRFIDFVVHFAPAAPTVRPQGGRVEWGQLDDALRRVYQWRSTDVHAGIPFPSPMLEAPVRDAAGVLCERFPALAAQQSGGSWPAESLPMYLHTFAFIAHQALTNWWEALPDSHLIPKLLERANGDPQTSTSRRRDGGQGAP